MQRVLHRNIQDARAIDVTLGFVKPTNKVTTTINQHKRKYPQEQVRTQSENKQTAWSQALLHLIGWSNGGQFSRPITDRSKATQCNPGLLPKHNWKLPYTRDTGYLDSEENSLIFLKRFPLERALYGGGGKGGVSLWLIFPWVKQQEDNNSLEKHKNDRANLMPSICCTGEIIPAWKKNNKCITSTINEWHLLDDKSVILLPS